MNLQPISGPSFRFTCIRCGVLHTHGGALTARSRAHVDLEAVAERPHADLDGVPFAAYYCGRCVQVRRAEQAAADIVHGPIVEVRA